MRETLNPKSSSTSKVNAPHKAFDDPAHVVVDPVLSNDQKQRALAALEQDARQLSVATGEGMEGGEPANLREVLLAKKSVGESPDAAFASVVAALKSRLAQAEGTDAHAVIANAIDAIGAARKAIAQLGETATPPGAPRPGSRDELEEELAKEKLDP